MQQLLSKTHSAINDFNMVEENDKIHILLMVKQIDKI